MNELDQVQRRIFTRALLEYVDAGGPVAIGRVGPVITFTVRVEADFDAILTADDGWKQP